MSRKKLITCDALRAATGMSTYFDSSLDIEYYLRGVKSGVETWELSMTLHDEGCPV